VVASRENFPLLKELLADQQRLQTPVAQFADSLAATGLATPGVRHSALIPLSAPRPGEQYAFEVDLDSCTGCKSCVAACHSLNGLEDNETWRDVGLLVGTSRAHPFSQTVTTACHHCADPACLNGCPVLAYEKDPVTGIVRHLDDQCIGCSYCILKCPYDVPKFSERLGIVRKCDMCHDRLAHGEAPACVQACPTHAIKIVTVAIPSPASALSNSGAEFLPGTPDPSYTQPTTRYVSKRSFPDDVIAADATVLRPQPPHWPLVFLLVLTPLAVGCGLADSILAPSSPSLAVACWLAGAVGLACSVLHLGQPTRAWRIFLGLRKSWLSREAVVFGAWFPLATVHALVRLEWLNLESAGLRSTLAIITAGLGILGLYCSVMIYADTQRRFWRFANTAPRFFGTAAVLGLATALCVGGGTRLLGFALVTATMAKLLLEGRALDPLNGDRDTFTPERQTALLLEGILRPVNEFRILVAILGGVLIPLALALELAPTGLAWSALALCLAGELAERYLFFRAVDAPKMPGLPSAAARERSPG
jgi:Fe-S-cluster-containing dehydrogenase component/DMSO reductase anchor subunit